MLHARSASTSLRLNVSAAENSTLTFLISTSNTPNSNVQNFSTRLKNRCQRNYFIIYFD